MIPAGHLVVPVGLMAVNPVTFTGRCCNCCCTLPLSISLSLSFPSNKILNHHARSHHTRRKRKLASESSHSQTCSSDECNGSFLHRRRMCCLFFPFLVAFLEKNALFHACKQRKGVRVMDRWPSSVYKNIYSVCDASGSLERDHLFKSAGRPFGHRPLPVFLYCRYR